MKQKEGKKKENKKRRIVKRQVSIITIFLWIFLVMTMITITTNSIRKNNAIVEIDSGEWNVSLAMYDRSSSTSTDAMTDFTWNTTNEDESKVLIMQTNYSCTMGKQYNPGELIIEVDGISKESFSELNRRNNGIYSSWLNSDITISADKIADETKEYDWSYSYDENSNKYTFINNITMKENEHFEGSIQIVYNLKPYFKIQTDLEFKAKLKENIANAEEIIEKESNICNFHYTSKKTTYDLNILSLAGARADYTKIKDILDDYYWVRYEYSGALKEKNIIYAISDNEEVMRYNEFIFDENNCIKTTLPEGAVLYDENLNKIEAKEGNTYYYLTTSEKYKSLYYYVGYPKSKYKEGDKVKNTAELWGRYEDEGEMQKLAEASSTASLVIFKFEYTGELYSVQKRYVENGSGNDSHYANKIRYDTARSWWELGVIAFYTDSKMDVEIGDDLLYITRENGEVTKLEDDEYDFQFVEIPRFYTYDEYKNARGEALVGYNYEVQVRYKNTNEYVVYEEGITSNNGKRINFDRDDIVGVKIVIKDLDKTLYQKYGSYHDWDTVIESDINIYTEDCREGGYLYNFDYLQVYKKDENGDRILANPVTRDNYGTESTKLKIAENDINTYGKYMQRDFSKLEIKDGYAKLGVRKSYTNLSNNIKTKKYELNYKLSAVFDAVYYEVNKDVIIKQYDILPSGMNLASSKEEIINNIYIDNLFYGEIKLKDGTIFNSKEELEKYIRENTTVDIDYNYRNSGRTKISIIYNLNGMDWSYCKGDIGGVGIYTELEVEIPYDSILEYGTKYTNYVYGMWNNQEYEYTSNYWIHLAIDNGECDLLASDIDNDGDTEEIVGYSSDTLNINHAVSSQQSVITQVRTDLTKGSFVDGTAKVSSGSDYTYKLEVTTGANSLKDLILYDTLETTYSSETGEEITEGWKGKFLGVDTLYALSKGYAPKVYYSEEKNPGKLTEVPEKWIELTNEVDKSKVKSICVDLRYKEDGTEMELTPNNIVFVLVNMQAPDDDTLTISSHNMFNTNWRAIDPLGGVVDNVEGIYSNKVNLTIYNVEEKTIAGIKTWDDLNNKYKLRPESITIKLLQDGIEYMRKEVTGDGNSWRYVFKDVPIYKNENKDEYEYTIEEVKIPLYNSIYNKYSIENKLEITELKVKKVWDDNENIRGLRPKNVLIKVYDGEKEMVSKRISESDDWKYTFKLPKYRIDGSKIEYRIEEEVDLYQGDNSQSGLNFKSYEDYLLYNLSYISQVSGTIITNKYVDVGRKKITVKKVWDDNENIRGLRPEKVLIKVYDDEKEIVAKYISESDDWTYTCELPEYRIDGSKREYRIEEEVELYREGNKNNGLNFKSYEDYLLYNLTYISQVSGTTITNKYIGGTKITVKKVWDDNKDIRMLRPYTILIKVYDGEKEIFSKYISESDDWTYTCELPEYRIDGSKIEYRIEEEVEKYFKPYNSDYQSPNFRGPLAPHQFFARYKMNYIEQKVGNNITNKYIEPSKRVKIVGTKVWEDENNKVGKRPESVTLQLKIGEKIIDERIVTGETNWSYEFETAKYDEEGNEIKYHIDEKETFKFYDKELTDENIVTNKFVVPDEKKSIEVMKVWEDNGNEALKRPSSVKLQIKRNGTVMEEAEVNESTNWKHTFELQKYDERGDEIEYTVDEEELDEEASEFYVKNIVGNIITNTFVVPEDRIKIIGTKVWEDNGNAGGKRDDTVILQLKNEKNEVISEEEVSDENNWSYEFEVSKYDRLGKIVNYHIDERDTKNKFYTKELTDNNTVTNKFVVPDEKVLVKAVKLWEDNNNSAGKRPSSVTLQIYNKDVLVAKKKVSEENNWNFEVELPKYDELGEEIIYTVDEKETSKYYEKSVEGLTVINKLMYDLPNTSDINVLLYIVIFVVAIVITIVTVIFIHNKK